jgi:hypothetical protein
MKFYFHPDAKEEFDGAIEFSQQVSIWSYLSDQISFSPNRCSCTSSSSARRAIRDRLEQSSCIISSGDYDARQ